MLETDENVNEETPDAPAEDAADAPDQVAEEVVAPEEPAEEPSAEEVADTARQEVFNLRFQHATGQLENTARLRQAKQDLARALTVARQRGIDVETEIRRLRKINA